MRDGKSKNENAFNKMKEMIGGTPSGVFEYRPQFEEPEIELDEEIKSDLEDDD